LVERESFCDPFYEKFVKRLSMSMSGDGKIKLMASTIMYASTPIKLLESVQSCQGLASPHGIARVLGAYFSSSQRELISLCLFWSKLPNTVLCRITGMEDLESRQFVSRMYKGECVLLFDGLLKELHTNYMRSSITSDSSAKNVVSFNILACVTLSCKYDGTEMSRDAIQKWSSSLFDFEVHHMRDLLAYTSRSDVKLCPYPLGFFPKVIFCKKEDDLVVDFKGLVSHCKKWFDFLAYGYIMPDALSPLFHVGLLEFSPEPSVMKEKDLPTIYSFNLSDGEQLDFDQSDEGDGESVSDEVEEGIDIGDFQ